MSSPSAPNQSDEASSTIAELFQLPWARSLGGGDDGLKNHHWDILPEPSRVLSIRRPGTEQKKLDLSEILSAANALAESDYARFGCELRGCVERLPALKEKERQVRSPKAVLPAKGSPQGRY